MNHQLSNKPRKDMNAQHLPGLQRIMPFISGWTSIRNGNQLPEGHYQTNQLQPPIHMEKSKGATRVHRQWILSLTDQSIVLYTDGSKLDNGKVGAGWAIYCIGSGINQLVLNSFCFLGFYMEIYDAELHAVYEALHSLNLLDIPITQKFICIDNFSAIQTLVIKITRNLQK
jgi:hypothetical protein